MQNVIQWNLKSFFFQKLTKTAPMLPGHPKSSQMSSELKGGNRVLPLDNRDLQKEKNRSSGVFALILPFESDFLLKKKEKRKRFSGVFALIYY